MLKLLIGIRNGFSSLISKCFKETSWQPDVSNWDMRILRDWVNNHYVRKDDGVDYIRSVKRMNWQLKKYSFISGDCEDLATYTLYLALRIFGRDARCYRINIVRESGLLLKHTFGVFYANGKWYWTSNKLISEDGFGWDYEAIADYVKGKKYKVETLTLEDLYG